MATLQPHHHHCRHAPLAAAIAPQLAATVASCGVLLAPHGAFPFPLPLSLSLPSPPLAPTEDERRSWPTACAVSDLGPLRPDPARPTLDLVWRPACGDWPMRAYQLLSRSARVLRRLMGARSTPTFADPTTTGRLPPNSGHQAVVRSLTNHGSLSTYGGPHPLVGARAMVFLPGCGGGGLVVPVVAVLPPGGSTCAGGQG